MNRALGIALLVVGVLLVFWGTQSSNSTASDFSKFFTGSPTNKSIWLLLGGIISMITGGVLVARPAAR